MSHRGDEQAGAELNAEMDELLHAACSLQCDAYWLLLLLLNLRSCRRPGVRACVHDVSCARAASVAGAHCVVWVWCKAGARLCAKICRELFGVGRVGGVRPRRFRVCVRGTPCGGRSRVRECVQSVACCGRAHLHGAPSAGTWPPFLFRGGNSVRVVRYSLLLFR